VRCVAVPLGGRMRTRGLNAPAALQEAKGTARRDSAALNVRDVLRPAERSNEGRRGQ